MGNGTPRSASTENRVNFALGKEGFAPLLNRANAPARDCPVDVTVGRGPRRVSAPRTGYTLETSNVCVHAGENEMLVIGYRAPLSANRKCPKPWP